MGLTNSQRRFNNERLQIEYDSYIAKKIQEEEQKQYEERKKIEQDDFEFAKKLQEEEKQLSSQITSSLLQNKNGQFINMIDLTQIDVNNTRIYNKDKNHHSPIKNQQPKVNLHENKGSNKIKSENKIGTNIVRKREIIDEKSDFEIKKKVKIEKAKDTRNNRFDANSSFGKKEIDINIEKTIESHSIRKEKNKHLEQQQQNLLIRNVISNYNLNHRPKKEISNVLTDIKTELINNKMQQLKSMGVYSNVNQNPLKNISHVEKDDLTKSLPTVNSLLKKFNTKNINNNQPLTNNNIKGKAIQSFSDEMLSEQLQREEVLINSLSDQPFNPQKSDVPTSSMDKVKEIILEQERLLQEYNRKRKGKERDERDSPIKSVVPINNLKVNHTASLKKFNANSINELDDPCPDLHQLFLLFNAQYFHHKLDSVEVRWSKRMTLCAGICYYYPGGYCSVRLSEPLLKFRTRDDFINTLLHEMIHAYLFLTEGNKDHDGHGESFHRIMYKLNKETGSNITVYHNFHNEVNHYRTHVWRCNGPCRNRPPFFGYVRRSMNRKPQKADHWWRQHQMTCGGEFIKISEPEEYTRKRLKKQQKDGSDTMIDKTLLNQPSTSDFDNFQRLKTINTTTISKPRSTQITKPTNFIKSVNQIKPTQLTKPTLTKPKPRLFNPTKVNSPNHSKPDLSFRTKIFDPRTKREFDGGGHFIQAHADDEIDDGTNDFSNHNILRHPTNTRSFGGTSGKLFGRSGNVHGFKDKKNTSSSITTTSKPGSNIHGFGSLKKTVSNTVSTSKPGSNIHGFSSFKKNNSNTTNSTKKNKTSGSNKSIYDFLKRKK